MVRRPGCATGYRAREGGWLRGGLSEGVDPIDPAVKAQMVDRREVPRG